MEQIEQTQQEQRHLEGRVGHAGAPHHDHEAQSDLKQAEAELQRRVGVQVALAQEGPERGHDRCEDQDEARIERLGLGRRDGGVDPGTRRAETGGGDLGRGADGDAQKLERLRGDAEIDVTVGEQVQRGSGLFEQGEEDDRPEDQHQGQHHPLTLRLALANLDDDVEDEQQRRDGGGAKNPTHQGVALNHEPDDADAQDAEQIDRPFAVDRTQHGFAQIGFGRRLALALQQGFAQHEDHPAQRHADAGQAEACPPADGLTQKAAQHRRPEGAEVDAVVVEGEAGIPSWVALRIQLAHDGRDVGLQEADAHDDEGHRQIEDVHARHVAGRVDLVLAGRQHGRQRRRGRQVLDRQAVLGRLEGVFLAVDDDRHFTRRAAAFGVDLIGLTGVGQGFGGGTALESHHAVTGDQEQGAEGDGLARADEAVGHDAAQQGQQIDQGGVGAVGRPRHGVVEQEVLRQEEDQDAAHAVVGETLPHLGEEQDDQSARVVFEDLHQHRHARGEGDDQSKGDDDVHARVPLIVFTRRVSRAFPKSVLNGSLPTAAPLIGRAKGAYPAQRANPNKC